MSILETHLWYCDSVSELCCLCGRHCFLWTFIKKNQQTQLCLTRLFCFKYANDSRMYIIKKQKQRKKETAGAVLLVRPVLSKDGGSKKILFTSRSE